MQFKNFSLAHSGPNIWAVNARETTYLTKQTHINPFLGKCSNFLVKLINQMQRGLLKARVFE